MDVDTDLEHLMSHLGECGRYQVRQFLLHILAAFTAGMHMFSLVTVAAVPEHRCFIPGVDDNGIAPWNSPAVKAAIPSDSSGVLDSCHRYDAHNNTIECSSWVYNDEHYKTSKAIEWNFVCNRRWMGAVAQTCYMLGVFIGAVVLGSLADKYGRKIIFYISGILQMILGVVVAFIPEFYSFLVIRFLYGVFGSSGAYIAGFVLTMELVGPSRRTTCGMTFQGMFAAGVMMVAFWGFLIKDCSMLQIIYGLHGGLLLGHWWLMDESPRWLWSQGRVHEAVKIVERAVKVNKKDVTLDVAYFVSKGKVVTTHSVKSNSILDLFRTPNLRSRTLNACLNWFANSLVYYGLSLNTGKLYGDPFLILFIMAVIEIPSYIVTTLLMDRTGRRCLISAFLLIGGIGCIVSAYIPQDTTFGSTSATSVVMIGKFFIAGSFAIIYNYTAELFPTVIRNTALGLGSMCARLSGALTPLITLLDSLNKTLPSVIFASIAILSGILSLLLPETLNKPLPQTLEDGEEFGKGDTACRNCCGRRKRDYDVALTDQA